MREHQRASLLGRGVRIGATVSIAAVGLAAVPVAVGSAGASPAPIHVAVLNESTGEFGAQFGAIVPGATAWADYVNAHGGLNGHHIILKTYDGASNPTTAVSNAHLAVQQGAEAIIDTDPLFDSYAPYLKTTDIPVYAFGITPGFYGTNETSFFSYSGNVTTGLATASVKFLVANKGKKKFAVISDASPADSVDSKANVGLINKVGGTVVYQNFNVDPTNTAALISVAQAIKASGAQVVASAAGGTEAQFQADLAQVGAGNIWVSDGSDYEQNLPEQFGSALNNYTFYFFTAPFTANTTGIHNYLAAMKKYEPSSEYSFNALVGWASGELLAGGVSKLGSKAVTGPNITAATNKLTNYNGQGSFPSISFPLYHEESTHCFAFVQVQNKKWVQLSGNKSTPFYCSAPLK